jgi:hypothetical protein
MKATMDSVLDTEKPGPENEIVFTVTDYYDGPRQGIANFEGEPHFYECISDPSTDIELYFLTPIDNQTFRLAMEDWDIWRRWEAAFHAGKTSQETHPALPEDRARHEELEQLLDKSLQSSPDAIKRTGTFTTVRQSEPMPGVMRRLQVRWSNPDS